ncbi:hypothetical protein OSTOST_12780 [Ostertagia ostertagi]
METLQGKWTSAENYAKGVTTEAERFALLQEFADHWDSIRADEALINAKALVRSIEEQLRDLTKTPVTPLKVVDVSDSSASSSELLVHVPKLELPDFYGEPSAFPEFWELYLAAIHNNPSIPAAVKFLHLKSKLKGKAKDLIASIELSPNNYLEASTYSIARYNRPDQLEALSPASESPIAQRTTLCKIKAIWMQLRNLKEQPGATGTMRIIRAKFPHSTRQRVGEMRQRDDHWTVEELLQAFDRVIDRLEVMEDTDPMTEVTSHTSAVYTPNSNSSYSPRRTQRHRPTNRHSSASSPHRHRSPQRKDHSLNESRCVFCVLKGHSPTQCREVATAHARRTLAAELQLCWKCLNHGHQSGDCNAPSCYMCGSGHHSALCYRRNTYRSPNRSNSPARNRFGSTERYDSNYYRSSSGDRSRRISRSPSPARRGRSPVVRQNTTRRSSPHPRVDFKTSPATHTYSSPAWMHQNIQDADYSTDGL